MTNISDGPTQRGQRVGPGSTTPPPHRPPTPPPTAPSTPSGRPKALKLIAASAIVAVVAGGAWGVLAPSSADASEAQIQLESVSSSGPSPFTAPVGADVENVVSPANATGQQPGNTGGLYAQDPDAPACDVPSLISQVTADPAKAAAWAAPLGTTAAGIPAFVDGLNPVTLRADTAVTEYGYSNGQFQPYPSVLQAGTAVLVNSFGEPTVKCYSGNPLGRPTASNTSENFANAGWAGFTVERTISVTPTGAPQRQLSVVNAKRNTQESRPIKKGTGQKTPPPPVDDQNKVQLTGVHNYDGTYTRSDGKVFRHDGTEVKPTKVDFAKPVTKLQDGGIRDGNGVIWNQNGTTRGPLTIPGTPDTVIPGTPPITIPGPFGTTITLPGTPPITIPGIPARTVKPNGEVTPPLDPGTLLKRNYDGSFMVIKPGKPGSVEMFGADGVKRNPAVPYPPDSTVNEDGSITVPPNGERRYPNGETIPPSTSIPPGGVLDDRNGNTDTRPTFLDPNDREVRLMAVDQDGQKLPPGTKVVGADGQAIEGARIGPDGTLVGPDGKPVTGSVVRPDGTVVGPDGTVVGPDGKAIAGAVVQPDGTITLPGGNVLLVDGSVIKPDGEVVSRPDGVITFKPDGSIQRPDGVVIQPNGQAKLPDGSVLLPDGKTQLTNGGIVPPVDEATTPAGTEPGTAPGGGPAVGTGPAAPPQVGGTGGVACPAGDTTCLPVEKPEVQPPPAVETDPGTGAGETGGATGADTGGGGGDTGGGETGGSTGGDTGGATGGGDTGGDSSGGGGG